MGASLAAIVYGTAALLLAMVLVSKMVRIPMVAAGFATWCILLVSLFVLRDDLLVLLVSGATLALFASRLPQEQRPGFLLLTVPALPHFMHFVVPFPGINYIISISHYDLAVLATAAAVIAGRRLGGRQVGVGALAQHRSDATGRTVCVLADLCIAYYILHSSLTVAANMGLTPGLRYLLQIFLQLGLPYLILSRALTSSEQLRHCFAGFFVASVILACTAAVSSFRSWDYYLTFAPSSALLGIEFRNNFIRINATANTHSLGYHLALAILMLPFLARTYAISRLKVCAILGLLLFGLFVTGSRGAWISGVAALALFATLRMRSQPLRVTALVSIVLALAVVLGWLSSDNFAANAELGNFDYRQRLLEICLIHIGQFPFGDFNYLFHPRFTELRQGQGIIDITNMYLQLALPFGVIAAGLFFLPFYLFLPTLAIHSVPDDAAADDKRMFRALICAGLAGWCFLVTTTSSVGLTQHLGIVLLALGRASLALGHNLGPARVAVPAAAPASIAATRSASL